ncbi:MAG: hypothetical protein J6X95_06480, partial [Treponema sp.]|nr:hypothetical protein [Treponema sp.]
GDKFHSANFQRMGKDKACSARKDKRKGKEKSNKGGRVFFAGTSSAIASDASKGRDDKARGGKQAGLLGG